MAVAKKTSAKKSTPAPRVRRIKKSNSPLKLPKVNFANLGFKKEAWDKHASLYPVVAVLAAVVIILAGLFIFKRGLFLAGSVNGQLVTTPEFYSKLIKSGGDSTFDGVVRDIIVQQEAQKKKISVSTKEVDDRVAELEKQFGGQDQFNKALSDSKVSLAELRSQLKIQLMAEKLVADQIQVSDDELNKFIADNQSTTAGQDKEQIREQLKSQKFNTAFTTWLDNAKKNAKIVKYY